MALIYDIGFRVDEGSLSTQLSSISREINAALTSATRGNPLSNELAAAVTQANILQQALKRATTDKGISFVNLNMELQRAGTSAASMVATLAKAGPQFQGSLNAFLQTFAVADRNLIGISNKVKEMQRVLAQSIKFNFAMGLQNFVMGEIQGAIKWVQDLNKALADIAVVAPEVAHKLDSVAASIIANSRALRITAQEYAEASLIYWQQGLRAEEVEARTEITVKAAKAAGDSMEEMAEKLTAVWNTYRMSGDELERSASVAAKLAADTAADMSDIAIGMQTAASGASMLGVSYNSLASIVATVRDVTQQSANTVGQAYKTIFARLSNLKTSGEDAGESLGRITQQLDDMGVSILDAAGDMRDLDEVIWELGTTWENYGRKQQIAIAQIVGGTRQYQQFLALMQNFDKYAKNLNVAESIIDGAELERQYQETLLTIETATKNATESFRRAFSQMFVSDAQIKFYKGLEGIGNLIESIIKSFGGLTGVLMLTGAYLTREIVPKVQSIAHGFTLWSKNLTVERQLAYAKEQLEEMRRQVALINELPGLQKSEGDVNNEYDQAKLSVLGQTQDAMIQLNNAEKAGTDITKAKVAALKEALTTTQANINLTLDSLRATREKAKVDQKMIDNQLNFIKEAAKRGDLEEKDKQAIESRKQQLELQSKLNTAVIQGSRRSIEGAEGYSKALGEAAEIMKDMGPLGATVGKVLEDQASIARSHIKYLQDQLEAGEIDPTEYADKLAHIESEFASTFAIASGAIAEFAEESFEAGRITESFHNELIRIANTMNKTAHDQDNLNTRFRVLAELGARVKTVLDESGTTLTGYYTKLGQMTSQLAMLGMGMMNVIKSFQDGTMTMGAFAAQTAMMLPQLVATIAGLKEFSLMTVKVTYALFNKAAVQQVAAAADMKAAVAAVQAATGTQAFAASLWKLMAPLLAVTAAIVALVAIIYVLAKAWQRYKASTPEGQLKGAKEEALRLAEAADQARQRADELRAAFEKYDSAIDKLESATKGTQEWRDALSEANQEALELLNKYPMFASMPDLFQRNADGMIEINQELREQMQNMADIQAQAASHAAAMANARVTQAEQRIARGTFLATEPGGTGTWQYDALKRAVADISVELSSLTTEEFEEKIREMAVSFGNAADLNDKNADRIAEYYLKNRENLAKLAEATTKATVQIDNASTMIAENVLQDDFGAAEKKIAANKYDNIYDTIFENVRSTIDSWGTTRKNKGDPELDEMWARYIEASGERLTLHANSIRGSGPNRSFAYLDPEDASKTKEVTAQQVASTIAAYEALNELKIAATDAQTVLSQLDRGVAGSVTGAEGVSDVQATAIKDWIAGGDFANMSYEAFSVFSEAAGSSAEEVQQYLLDAFDETDINELAKKLGQDSAEEMVAGFQQNLDLKEEWIKALSGLSELSGIEGISLNAAKNLQAALQTLTVDDTFSEIGVNGGKALINGINSILSGISDSDLQVETLEKLANVDWGNWNLGAGIDSLTEMRGIFEGLETVSGKYQWLENYNEKVADLNAEMQVMSSITGVALPQMEQLTSGFLNLSETAQKTYLAEQEVALATSNVTLAQTKLNNAMKSAQAIRDTWGDGADDIISLLNQVFDESEGGFSGLEAMKQEIENQIAVHDLTGEAAEALHAYYSEVSNGVMLLERMNHEQEDAEKKAAKLGAAAKSASLGITDFAQAVAALESGELSKTELDLLAPDLVKNVEELNMAWSLGGIASEEYAAHLGKLDYTVQDLDRAFDAGLITQTAYNNMLKNLENFDMDEIENYIDLIKMANKEGDEFADSLNDDRKGLESVAKAYKRANDARALFADKGKELIKTLRSEAILSEEYAVALKEMRTGMANLLNVNEDLISSEFITDPEHLALLEKAIGGNEEALDQLAREYVASVVATFNLDEEGAKIVLGLVDELANMPDIEIGAIATLDDSQYIETLNKMLENGEITEGKVNQALAGIGYEPVWSEETVPIKNEVAEPQTKTVGTWEPSTSYQQYLRMNPDGTVTRGAMPVTRYSYVETTEVIPNTRTVEGESSVFGFSGDGPPEIKGETRRVEGAKKISGAGNISRSPATSKATAPPPTTSGGGGSSKADTPTTASRQNTAKERYRDITSSLDEISRALGRVSTAEDKAFGFQRLALIEQKSNELQKQGQLYEKLAKEAQNYLTKDDQLSKVAFGNLPSGKERFLAGTMGDQARLQQMLDAAGIGMTASFNKDGVVSNAEQILNKLVDMADAEFTRLTKEWVDPETGIISRVFIGDKQEQAFSNLETVFEIIRNQIEKVDETAAKLQDTLEAQVANIHDWLSNKLTEVEYKMELRIQVNQRDYDQLQWLLTQLGDRAGFERMSNMEAQAEALLRQTNILSEAANRYLEIEKSLNASSSHQNWFKEQFGEDAWKEYQRTGHITDEMMSKMTATAEQMQETIQELWALNAEMWRLWNTALQQYIEDFDRLIGMYDSHQTMLDAWANIWRVAGEPWKNQRVQVDLLNKAIDNQSSKVQGLQQKYEFMNDKLADSEELYRTALADYGAEHVITQERLAEWKQLESDVLAAQADLASGISEMMNMIENAAREAAAVIAREFTEGLSGIFSEVGSAMDMFSQKKAIDNFFLHEEDLQFELNKMLREIAKDMEDVTDPTILANYSTWLDKINDLKDSGVQMTQTELDILKAEFELEKAQAAWQEQQQMKKTLRLARDASGNWSYVYSSDGSQGADSEADIEEKMHNLRKMHRDAADEASEMWLQVWVEYRNYIEEIDVQRYQQNEAYRNEVDARIGWYEQQLDLHAEQIIKHNTAIDRSFEEMTLSVITDTNDMMELNKAYKQNNQDLTDALMANHDEYQRKVEETLNAIGIDYNNLYNTIESETEAMMRKNQENEYSIRSLRMTADSELSAIMTKTRQWAERWRTEISQVISALDALIAKIYELERAQAGESFTWDKDYTAAIEEAKQAGVASKEWYEQQYRERYNKVRAAYEQELSQFAGNAEYMQKVKDEWSGPDWNPNMTQQEYVDKMMKQLGIVFDTGGLATGPMPALLAQDGRKEIVLNAHDTNNFLQAIEIMRDSISAHLSSLGTKRAGMISLVNPSTGETVNNQPPVIIQADFPSVTARQEIEAAFENLVNQAAQYQLKPRD